MSAALALAPRSVEELHRAHLKRTADFFSGDVGGRAELDEARRAPAGRVRGVR
jgi:hypothetical protein